MPPPQLYVPPLGFWALLLLTEVSMSARVPKLKMPPPSGALLLLTVLETTVSEPQFIMPPPPSEFEGLEPPVISRLRRVTPRSHEELEKGIAPIATVVYVPEPSMMVDDAGLVSSPAPWRVREYWGVRETIDRCSRYTPGAIIMASAESPDDAAQLIAA
jgi:hypothetical protein